MNKVEGGDIVDKYVTKVKKKESEPEHVGGSLGTDIDPLESDYKINKHGIDKMRDY